MKTAYKLLGGLFIVLGVLAALASDWLRVGLYTTMGASFIIGTQGTKQSQMIRGVLTLIAIGFAIAWFATN